MNIVVINGSPKGKYSCTLHTVLFLQKKFPQHTFEVLNAGLRIAAFEHDFSQAAAVLERADLLLFAYPVYTFIAPSQLHRFIELMKARGVRVQGKFATQITTSKHFYDVTAHRFVEENCHDMGLKVIKGLSADMDDLLTVKGQDDAVAFFRYVEWCVENDVHEPAPAAPPAAPVHMPVSVPAAARVGEAAASAAPAAPGAAGAAGAPSALAKSGNVAIVADLAPEDAQLSAMIARFQAVLPYASHVVNIHDFPFKSGCISCFNCATGGDCVFKDGFQEMLRDDIQQSDAIVIAFTIRDHSMGSTFKTYDDRQFCNGHRTVTMGKPFGYLVSGNLSAEENLRMIIEGRAEVGGNFLAGVATDETAPDVQIDLLAQRLAYAIEHRYVQPPNFLGVGGMKIFRDLIWLMQGMMKADHRFFKSHGQYDFPQKRRGTMLKMYLVGGLISNPKVKKKMGNKMSEGMIAPYKKVLDELE